MASNPIPKNWSVPACLESLNRRTQRQSTGYTYTIPCPKAELGVDAIFITLEKSDINDIATMDLISASVISVYEK